MYIVYFLERSSRYLPGHICRTRRTRTPGSTLDFREPQSWNYGPVMGQDVDLIFLGSFHHTPVQPRVTSLSTAPYKQCDGGYMTYDLALLNISHKTFFSYCFSCCAD